MPWHLLLILHALSSVKCPLFFFFAHFIVAFNVDSRAPQILWRLVGLHMAKIYSSFVPFLSTPFMVVF